MTLKTFSISLCSLVCIVAPNMGVTSQSQQYSYSTVTEYAWNNDPFAGASAPPMEDQPSMVLNSLPLHSHTMRFQTVDALRYTPTYNQYSHNRCKIDNASSFVVGITVASAVYLLITYLWHKLSRPKPIFPYQRPIEQYVDISEQVAKEQVFTAKDSYSGDWLIGEPKLR